MLFLNTRQPAKPLWLYHSDKTRSPVLLEIRAGSGVRLGVIWQIPDATDYTVWWGLGTGDRDVRPREMDHAIIDLVSIEQAKRRSYADIRRTVNAASKLRLKQY
jgi:hypothetical protein